MKSNAPMMVNCGCHGERVSAVVCRHMLEAQPAPAGFVEKCDDPYDLQAWCYYCEERYKFLDLLADDELPHIAAMIDNELAIDGFPEEGKASVSISWSIEEYRTGYGGLYMLSHEFELVGKSSATFVAR
jgi:hypothetical protein